MQDAGCRIHSLARTRLDGEPVYGGPAPCDLDAVTQTIDRKGRHTMKLKTLSMIAFAAVLDAGTLARVIFHPWYLVPMSRYRRVRLKGGFGKNTVPCNFPS